jgi:hypothetical protein
MRRSQRLALVLAVAYGVAALGTGPASAIISDNSIELNPTTPVAGSSFTASGDDCDALQYSTAVRNLLTDVTQTGTDTPPVGGHWTTTFATDWDNSLGPGWQVVAVQCDPDGDDWSSPTFFVPAATAVLPISIHLGDPGAGEQDGDYYATGIDCPTDTLLLQDITDDLEGFGGSTSVGVDGSWSFDVGGQDPTSYHLIAGCVDSESLLQQLYEYGGGETPVTPVTPDTPIAPLTPDPASALPASSVVAQPTLTG